LLRRRIEATLANQRPVARRAADSERDAKHAAAHRMCVSGGL
jgi:hypothetical protein